MTSTAARIVAFAAMALAFANRAVGQSPISRLSQRVDAGTGGLSSVHGGQDSATVWKAWVSLALGQLDGSVDEVPLRLPRPGGELSMWVTRNTFAVGARLAGMTEEGSGTGDVSVLVGYHVAPIPRVDGIIALGIGLNTLSAFADQPVVVANAQLNANLYVVGVGVDTFAAVGARRKYAGAGLALCVGWFR